MGFVGSRLQYAEVIPGCSIPLVFYHLFLLDSAFVGSRLQYAEVMLRLSQAVPFLSYFTICFYWIQHLLEVVSSMLRLCLGKNKKEERNVFHGSSRLWGCFG